MTRHREIVVDSFAGGGGASLGILWALGRGPDIAINHDKEAIALHAANHPESQHYAEDVWKVDPTEATQGRPVGLMWLSPDCKHFSKAKGGKPVSKDVRGLAWVALKWAKTVAPRVIVLENVEEFQTWGPLGADQRPDPKKKGVTFKSFITQLRNLGYQVEWKELRACDYGAPTIRRRLFIIARRDGRPIEWPQPTHSKKPTGGQKPWRTAAECIDFAIPCPSIFTRARPLAENTLKRIARGMRKFVIDNPKPFIVPVSHSGDQRSHSVDEPLRTITGSSRSTHAVVTPYIAGVGGRQGQSPERSVESPFQTITAKADSVMVAPTLINTRNGERPDQWMCANCNRVYDRSDLPVCGCTKCGSQEDPVLVPGQAPRVRDIEEPMATVTSHGSQGALVEAFLQTYYGPKGDKGVDRGQELELPLATQTTENRHGLVAAYITRHNTERSAGEVQASGADVPLSTITTRSTQINLTTAQLLKLKGTSKDGQPVVDPLHTVQAGGQHHALVTSHLAAMAQNANGGALHDPFPTVLAGATRFAEVRAFLLAYYGNEKDGADLIDPMRTVTAKDRLGLVTVEGHDYLIADIGMRMLVPRELYRAQGFPDSYRIEIPFNGKTLSKTAQVRMVGNSVCPPLAAAIVRANLGEITLTEAAA